MTQDLFGCIEAGGTKFVVALAKSPTEIVARGRFDTLTPQETLPAVFDWIAANAEGHGRLAAIGIASFGPLEADRAAPEWGHITNTPKPGWANCALAPMTAERFAVPVGFDTDVNGAALAEARWGAAASTRSAVYLTIGTGVGGGAVFARKVMHGMGHPEMGHYRPQRHPEDLDFRGICPFHGDCIEGLASGPAILARWGATLSDLPADHPAHHIIADYLGQLVVTIQAMLAPGCIIMGGGVMATPGLIDAVRDAAVARGAGYFRGHARALVLAPGLGADSGLLGAYALAAEALASAG